QGATPSLHAGALPLAPEARRAPRPARGDPGERPEPARVPAGLQVPHALPLRGRALRARGAAARRVAPRPPRRLSPPRSRGRGLAAPRTRRAGVVSTSPHPPPSAPASPPSPGGTLHIGIVACSSEGAALCYRTICLEAAARMGEHLHPEVSMHTHS